MGAGVSDYRDGTSRIVVLNRPQVRNALDWDTWTELSRILADIQADDSARSVILTGEGSCFSSGGDIRSMGSRGSSLRAPIARLELAQSVLLQLWKYPKPVVAAVEGYAVGVGWSLALACDFVIAAENAFFSAAFAKRALVPDGGLAWMLARSLGHAAAADVVYTGRKVSCEEAAGLGLVYESAPTGDSMRQAQELASGLDDLSLDATAGAKDLLRAAGNVGFSDFLDVERNIVALTFYGSDAAEGKAAFLGKRDPVYNEHLS